MTIKVYGFSSTNVQLLNTEILQSDQQLPEATDKERPAGCLAATANRPDIPLMLYTAYTSFLFTGKTCSIRFHFRFAWNRFLFRWELVLFPVCMEQVPFPVEIGSVSGLLGTISGSGAHGTVSVSGAHGTGSTSGLPETVLVRRELVLWVHRKPVYITNLEQPVHWSR